MAPSGATVVDAQPFEEGPVLFSQSLAGARVLGQGQGLHGPGLFSELQQNPAESLVPLGAGSSDAESDKLAHMQMDLSLSDLESGLVPSSYLTDSNEFGKVMRDVILKATINPTSLSLSLLVFLRQ